MPVFARSPYPRSSWRLASATLSIVLICAALSGRCSSSTTSTTAPSGVRCAVTLDAVSAKIPSGGGTRQIKVTADRECTWSAESSQSWISVPQPSGQGSATISYSVAANAQPRARSATIVIGSGQLTVEQDAVPCTVRIDPVDVSIGAAGGTSAFHVSTADECVWTASADAGWLTISGPRERSSSGRVDFAAAVNPGAARTGQLTLGGQAAVVHQNGAGTAEPPGPAACVFDVRPATVAVPAAGGVRSVSVETNPACQWTAASPVAWIGMTSGGIGTGSGSLSFTVSPNAGGARSETLLIAGKAVTVSQDAAEQPNSSTCTYSVSPLSHVIPAAGGTGSVRVSTASGCTWSARSTASWISLSPNAAASGNGTVSFTVAPNSEGERTGSLIVAGETVAVRQDAAPTPCNFAVVPTSHLVGPTAGTVAVTVTTATGCAWTVTSNAGWITAGAGRTDSGSVNLTIAGNSGAARTGTVTVAGQTVTVSQDGCTVSVAPASHSAPVEGTTVASDVTTSGTCQWTATSGASWISITTPQNGTGGGTVRMAVAANDGAARSGHVTIAGTTVSVTQAGWSFAVAPTSHTMSVEGGPATSNVTTGNSCQWKPTSSTPWITVTTGGSTTTGNGTAGFTVAPNAGAARSGSVTIADQTISVDQAACSLQVRPTDFSGMSEAGATRTVDIATGSACPWSATSSVGWLTITGAGSAIGDGQVSFTVAPNPAEARSGELTVSGVRVTVQQKSAPSASEKGDVKSVSGTCPNIAFTIKSTSFFADSATRYVAGLCGNVVQDAELDVKGFRQPDGKVLATNVEFKD